MSKTRTKETNNLESLQSEAIVLSELVKAKIELSDAEKKVLYWHNKGQSVHWIATALQLHQNTVKEIIDANV